MHDQRMALAFPKHEYEARLQSVRDKAEERGVDLLVVTDPKNICYLTGYDALSAYVPQLLLVPVSANQGVTFLLRELDVPCVSWTTHLDESQTVGYAERFITGNENVMDFVGPVIADMGWGRSRIGVELSSMALSVSHFWALQKCLPNVLWSDASFLVDWVRSIKSDCEVAVMREAGAIADAAMATALNEVAPGVHEAEVAAVTHAALIRGVNGAYGSGAKRPMFGNGGRTDSPHLGWFDDFYRQGQPSTFELGGLRHNYAAGLARTVYLGRPPAGYLELDKVVQDGMEAALTKMKSGSTAEEVEEAWRRVISPHGHVKSARIGYSIGVCFPNTSWVEPTVSLGPGDKTLLQENMVIHLMLSVFKNDIGYALSETFVIGDREPESLSKQPRGMTVKG